MKKNLRPTFISISLFSSLNALGEVTPILKAKPLATQASTTAQPALDSKPAVVQAPTKKVETKSEGEKEAAVQEETNNETPVEQVSLDLNLSEAQKAFKDFSAAIIKDQVVFYGTTSKECLEHFKVSYSKESSKSHDLVLSFEGPIECLDSKAQIESDKELARLSNTKDLKIKLQNRDGQVNLLTEDETKDKNRFVSEALVDDSNKELNYISPATIAEQKALEKEEKKKEELEAKLKRVTCNECNLTQEAVSEAQGILASLKKEKDLDSKKLSEIEKTLKEKEFSILQSGVLSANSPEALVAQKEKMSAFLSSNSEFSSKAAALYSSLAVKALAVNPDKKQAYQSSMNYLKEASLVPGLDEASIAQFKAKQTELVRQYVQSASQEGYSSAAYLDARALWGQTLFSQYQESGCMNVQSQPSATCFQIQQSLQGLSSLDQSAKQMEFQLMNQNPGIAAQQQAPSISGWSFGTQASYLPQQNVMGFPSYTTNSIQLPTQSMSQSFYLPQNFGTAPMLPASPQLQDRSMSSISQNPANFQGIL